MRLPYVLAIASIFAAATSAAAACPPLTVAPEVAERAGAAADAGWTRQETFDFTTAADAQGGVVSVVLYRQLVDPQCATVTVSAPGGEAVELARPGGEAAELLTLLTMGDEEAAEVVLAFWDEGYAGLRKMALLHSSSEHTREFVEVAIMHRIAEPWRDSSILTGFEPFRGKLSSQYHLVVAEESDPEMNAMILKMIGKSAARFGDLLGPAMPDWLYSYFNRAL